jgi:hypothetical protein
LIEDILSRLDKVRRTGAQNWIACCPVHQDKHPSMTLREESDGRILVNCFAGCSFEQIAESVGLGWDAWFPPKPIDYAAPVKRPYPASDVLLALQFEALVVSVAACNIANGKELTNEDRARLMTAYDRISSARRMALGEH